MESSPQNGCHLTADGLAWHRRFSEALESHDVEKYLAFLHDDCTVQINNALPFYSKAAVRAAYSLQLTLYRTLKVETLSVLGSDRHSATEALLHYVCNDGSTEVVQCVFVIERDETGLVVAARTFGNTSRVFKPFMPAND